MFNVKKAYNFRLFQPLDVIRQLGVSWQVGLKLWSTRSSSNTFHWPVEKKRKNALKKPIHGLFAAHNSDV